MKYTMKYTKKYTINEYIMKYTMKYGSEGDDSLKAFHSRQKELRELGTREKVRGCYWKEK